MSVHLEPYMLITAYSPDEEANFIAPDISDAGKTLDFTEIFFDFTISLIYLDAEDNTVSSAVAIHVPKSKPLITIPLNMVSETETLMVPSGDPLLF